MVWGCFGGEIVGLGEICECIKLLECLVCNALPVVQRVNDTIGDAVFQRGNALVHSGSAVTEQLEQHTFGSMNTLPTRQTSISSNILKQ